MNKFSFKALLLAFAIVISPTTSLARCSTETKILIAGGLALGGFVLYKLVKMGVFDKPEAQVINDALSAINTGVKLSEIDILDQHYNILGLTDSEKRRKIDNIHEGVLYQLTPAVFRYDRVDWYLDKLNSIISEIKNSRNELKDCLTRQNCNQRDLHNLLNTIHDLLPKLTFLRDYVNAHQGYFNLFKIVKQLDNEYEREIDLVSSANVSYQDFKWIIRNAGCKIDPKYPFISYIKNLTSKTDSLNQNLSQLTYKYKDLLSYANNIKHKLNSIHDNAIADEEYSRETRERADENRKKEELALKEKEFALKQQMELEKLAIKEREATAREREAKAKEQIAAAREREAQAREYALHLKEFENRR